MEEEKGKQGKTQGYWLEKHPSMLLRCETHDYTPRCFYMVKRSHPEYFRVRHDVTVQGVRFAAVGNYFLLSHPVKIQIQCSRRMTPEQVETQKQKVLTEAARGAVPVSPCISPGEKAIMRAAFEADCPEIILEENGFAELHKPSGSRFDACSRGQLLFLAPWPHHHERRDIQRMQCLQLNALAALICLERLPDNDRP